MSRSLLLTAAVAATVGSVALFVQERHELSLLLLLAAVIFAVLYGNTNGS